MTENNSNFMTDLVAELAERMGISRMQVGQTLADLKLEDLEGELSSRVEKVREELAVVKERITQTERQLLREGALSDGRVQTLDVEAGDRLEDMNVPDSLSLRSGSYYFPTRGAAEVGYAAGDTLQVHVVFMAAELSEKDAVASRWMREYYRSDDDRKVVGDSTGAEWRKVVTPGCRGRNMMHFISPGMLATDPWTSDWLIGDHFPPPAPGGGSSLPFVESVTLSFNLSFTVSEDDVRIQQEYDELRKRKNKLQDDLHKLSNLQRDLPSLEKQIRRKIARQFINEADPTAIEKLSAISIDSAKLLADSSKQKK